MTYSANVRNFIFLGDASCLFAMRVLWTPIVEAMVEKRCITLSHAITMLLAVLGAILITQPVFLGFPQAHSLDDFPNLYLAYALALVAGRNGEVLMLFLWEGGGVSFFFFFLIY